MRSSIWCPGFCSSGLAALMLVAWATHTLYEHVHLSAGMRQTLLADLSVDTLPPHVDTVLRSAHLRIHTSRDAEEYRKLEHTLQLSAEAHLAGVRVAETQRQDLLNAKQEMHSEELMQITQRLYLSQHLQMSTGLGDAITEELEKREGQRAAEQHAAEMAQLHYLELRLDARMSQQQLRHDLGLAPGQDAGW